MISHWDEVRTWRGERGHIAGTWSSLTGRSSSTVGAKRIQIDPDMWSTPLHLEGSEEEIFWVLAGSGTSVQWDGEETLGYEVRAGDCLVHLARDNAHTLHAGTDGLDVIAFGQRTYAAGITWLPRAGVAWLGETWAPVGDEDDHPWTREAAAGPPEIAELSPRPANIVNVADIEPGEHESTTLGRRARYMSREAGSVRTGLRHVEVFPGKLNAPPHCHSAEEEIFVVLGGEGQLLLWEEDGVTEHPVHAGSIVCRPPGTGVAHAFRGGDDGMSLLARPERHVLLPALAQALHPRPRADHPGRRATGLPGWGGLTALEGVSAEGGKVTQSWPCPACSRGSSRGPSPSPISRSRTSPLRRSRILHGSRWSPSPLSLRSPRPR